MSLVFFFFKARFWDNLIIGDSIKGNIKNNYDFFFAGFLINVIIIIPLCLRNKKEFVGEGEQKDTCRTPWELDSVSGKGHLKKRDV